MSVKTIMPSQDPRKVSKRRSSESIKSSTEIKKSSSTNTLNSSSDALEKATIRGYGNPCSSMHTSDKDLTFHKVFYGV